MCVWMVLIVPVLTIGTAVGALKWISTASHRARSA